MANPYHDADGKFASRDELAAKIDAAQKAQNFEVYYRERRNLDEIEENLAKEKAKEQAELDAQTRVQATVTRILSRGRLGDAAEIYRLDNLFLEKQIADAEAKGDPFPAQMVSMSRNSIRRAYDQNDDNGVRLPKGNVFPDSDPTEAEAYNDRVEKEISGIQKTLDAEPARSRDELHPSERRRLENKVKALKEAASKWNTITAHPNIKTMAEAREQFRFTMRLATERAQERARYGAIEGYNLAISFENNIIIAD